MRHGHIPGARDHDRDRPGGRSPAAGAQRKATEGETIRSSPSILPRYARRSKSFEVLIPILYLKGISTGDFEEALAALVGKEASVYRRRPSPASRRRGARSMSAGRSATCRQSATSTSGPTASTSGATRGAGAVHPRHHRRDAGRQEGACRVHRWHARELTVMA